MIPLEFDQEGFHTFDTKECRFISDVSIHKTEPEVLRVEFYEGYLADFNSEDIADNLDAKLREIEGIKTVHWQDRELFLITHNQIQIEELIKRIDKKVIELSEE